ncbi:MAG: hypothetical protein QOH72_3778, partial [Solirubrobacteraceae bacterium]|nr:hypothetical protein [Solirubrobacteraceae bacterium]
MRKSPLTRSAAAGRNAAASSNPGTLGQLGRRERVPDRPQILELMLGGSKARTQDSEILLAHGGF